MGTSASTRSGQEVSMSSTIGATVRLLYPGDSGCYFTSRTQLIEALKLSMFELVIDVPMPNAQTYLRYRPLWDTLDRVLRTHMYTEQDSSVLDELSMLHNLATDKPTFFGMSDFARWQYVNDLQQLRAIWHHTLAMTDELVWS